MRKAAVLFCACVCAYAFGVPVREHALAATAPTPVPTPTVLVTPPPPFPGADESLPPVASPSATVTAQPVPESMETASGGATAEPSATPTPVASATPVRVLIHAFPLPPKSGHQPPQTATPVAAPVAAPSATPTPAPQEPTVNVTVGPGSAEFETVPPSTAPTVSSARGSSTRRRRAAATPSPTASPSAAPATSAPTPTLLPTPTLIPTLTPATSTPAAGTVRAPLTPAPAASPHPHGVTPALFSAEEKDRAYDLVGGKWTCRTFAGTPIEHQYRRAEDAVSLDVDTSLAVDGQKVTLHETYRLHRTSGRWSVSLVAGQFIATAPHWTGQSWTFTGIDTENGRAFDSSMTYKRANVDEFTRTFDRTDDGVTKTYSGEHCLRVSY